MESTFLMINVVLSKILIICQLLVTVALASEGAEAENSLVNIIPTVQDIFSKYKSTAKYEVVEMYIGDEVVSGGEKIYCGNPLEQNSLWPGGNYTVDQNGQKVEKYSNSAAIVFYCLNSIKETVLSKIKRKFTEYQSKNGSFKIHYLYSGEMVKLGGKSIVCTLEGSRTYTDGFVIAASDYRRYSLLLMEDGSYSYSEKEAKHIIHCKLKLYFKDSNGNEDASVKEIREQDEIQPAVDNLKRRRLCMSIKYYQNINQPPEKMLVGAHVSLVVQDNVSSNEEEVYSLALSESRVIHDLCVAAEELGYCTCVQKSSRYY